MKHITRKTLGALLALVMVLALLPAVTTTARADVHTHDFEYSASGDTITATCKNEGCDLTGNKVTLRIVPTTNLFANDGTSKEASLEGLEAYNAATGRNLSTSNIAYYKSGNTVGASKIKSGNLSTGTYEARIAYNGTDNFGNKVAKASFTVTLKPVEHTHSFSYTANGAVITATCTSRTGTCSLANKQATLTLNAPEHTVFGDGKSANATFTGEIPGVTNPTIHYRRSDTPLSSAPTDAGAYTAWCQLGNATASVEYTIGKATNNGWTTVPHKIDNLVYTGQPQDLITAGVPSAGNALYTVGTDPDNEPNVDAGGMPYSGSVPKMTDAGTYYVWCKIDGGKNYTSINAQKVEVTIARADITPSVSIVGWTYGQTANTPMVGDTDNPGNGEVTYTYKVKDADDSTYKSTVPTAAGNYTVKAVIAETANYNSGVATKDFTISKADPTAPTGLTATYGQTLANVTLPDGWTWADSTQSVGNVVDPAATFKANFAGDDNHNAASNVDVTVTVGKANAVAATVTANSRTYDGTEKPLVTVTGEATGGEMQYALGTATEATEPYTTSIPTATNAGTYYVWYKAVGDDNHSDTAPACVEVTVKSRPVYQPSAPSSALTVTSEIGTITRVTVDGKMVDSKYYTVSGSNVVLSDEFIRSLANGTHTIRLYDGKTYATATWNVTGNTAADIKSATTADAGVAIYGILAVSSTLGLAWMGKKRKAA